MSHAAAAVRGSRAARRAVLQRRRNACRRAPRQRRRPLPRRAPRRYPAPAPASLRTHTCRARLACKRVRVRVCACACARAIRVSCRVRRAAAAARRPRVAPAAHSRTYPAVAAGAAAAAASRSRQRCRTRTSRPAALQLRAAPSGGAAVQHSCASGGGGGGGGMMSPHPRQRRRLAHPSPPLPLAALLHTVVVVVCALAAAHCAAAAADGVPYYMETVVGREDGAVASQSAIFTPRGLFLDAAGTLYVVDSSTNRIRVVSPDGVLTTVAGCRSSGANGDGGPATLAQLYTPYDVAVDAGGNMVIADYANGRVRFVNASSGVITTAAGTGTPGMSGDGGPATLAQLSGPIGVRFDGAGGFYVSDTATNRVRRVGADGVIVTVAGDGGAGFAGDGGPAPPSQLRGPAGIAVDAATGDLYIADSANCRVRLVAAASGNISTVVGAGGCTSKGDGGPATNATVAYPSAVALDAAGSLYIVESSARVVRKVVAGVISRVAGSGVYGYGGDGGPATAAMFNYPSGVAVTPAGVVYVSDTGTNRIRRVSPAGVITTYAGNGNTRYGGDGGPAAAASLYRPSAVALDASGGLYVTDASNAAVRWLALGGNITLVAGRGGTTFVDGGNATAVYLPNPATVVVLANGSVAFADQTCRIILFTPGGTTLRLLAGTGVQGFNGDGLPATASMIAAPAGLSVGLPGTLLAFCDAHRVRVVATNGTMLLVAGNGAAGYAGDGGAAPLARLSSPSGTAPAPDGVLYIADRGNHRVRAVSRAGVITTVVGTGGMGFNTDGLAGTATMLNAPWGVAVDAAGVLYIADAGNNRIRRLPPGGVVTTIGGTGSQAFNPDAGAALLGVMNGPHGVALRRDGTLFVADTGNDAIHMLTPGPSIARVTPALLAAAVAYAAPVAVNFTLAGGAGENRTAEVTAVAVGGVPCAAVRVVNATAVVCVDWPLSAVAAAPGARSAALAVVATWRGMPVACGTVTLVLPPVITLTSPARGQAGDMLVVTGANFQFGAAAAGAADAPVVTVGGALCAPVVVIVADSQLRCTLPPVAALNGTYPAVPIVVTSWSGQSSWPASAAAIEYPTVVSVAYAATPPTQWVWPSDPAATGAASDGAALYAPAAPLAFRAASAAALTCTAQLAGVAAVACDAPAAPNAGGPDVAALVGNVTTTFATQYAAPATAALRAVGLAALSGTACRVVIACRSATGDAGVSATPAMLATPALSLAWHTPPALVTVPTPLLQLAANFSAAAASAGASLPPTPLPPDAVSCVALLLDAAAALPSRQAPYALVADAAVASAAAPVQAVAGTAGSLAVDVTLSAAGCSVGAAYRVALECTWAPTAERVRVPTSVSVAVPAVRVTVVPAATVTPAYEAVASWRATLALTVGGVAQPLAAANFSSATGVCAVEAVTASTPALLLSSATVAAAYAVAANGTVAGGVLVVEGPPGATLYWRLACSVWGQTVRSTQVPLTTSAYGVAFATAGTPATPPLASDALGAPLLPLAPPPTVVAHAQGGVTCSLAVDAATVVCPPATPRYGAAYLPTGAPLTTSLVGTASLSAAPAAAAAAAAALTFTNVGVRAAGGCAFNLSATCRDGVGRAAAAAAAASTAAPVLAALLAAPGAPAGATAAAAWPVVVAALAVQWSAATVRDAAAGALAALPPGPVPPLVAVVTATAAPAAVPLPLPPDAATVLACTAALLPAAVAVPWATPLATAAAAAGAPSCTAAVASNGTASVVVAVDCLSAAAAAFGAALAVHCECVWPPSGERLRLPPLPAAVVAVNVTLAPDAGAARPWPPVVIGNAPHTLQVSLAVSGGAATSSLCRLVLVAATARTARLQADDWSVTAAPAPAPPAVTLVAYTLLAAGGVGATVRVECVAWGQTASSAPLVVTAAALAVVARGPLPTLFIASDVSTPWPVTPPLTAAVTAPTGDAATDVVCSLTAATAGARVAAVAAASGAASLLSFGADAGGAVAVPAFFVEQPLAATGAVNLTLACTRPSGDAIAPLAFAVAPVALRLVTCVPPVALALVAVPLPPFSYAVTTALPGGGADDPCGVAPPLPLPLPPITCTLAVNASAGARDGANDTAAALILPKNSLAVVDAATRRATFDAFTLLAAQGVAYQVRTACSLGSLTVPAPVEWPLTLAGCPVGQESVAVTCAVCGGGKFSPGGLGARCTGCPPRGAECVDGVLRLLPHYYRPAAQDGAPLGPDTDLYSCFNGDACTLATNGSAAVYGCAAGYSGPLCGVCDAAAGFVRVGDACSACWPPAAAGAFVAAAAAVVAALLTRVALRTDTSRSDASIALRIAMSYLQAAGSLRVFTAGGTKAYHAVMGWTDAVSASPLSVGALQCLLPMPYLVQYIATLALPLAAAAAVIAIFFVATTAAALRCSPRCAFEGGAWRAAVRAWLAQKRHWSTLLFVLFVAYIAITSASLRALDCLPPVAGTRYLRSDLRVACGGSAHSAATALAYAVLVAVGVGFPAGLVWLLGTASATELTDAAFHGTWGFLYDGYRAPRLELVASGGSSGSGSGGVPPPPAIVAALAAARAAAATPGKLAAAPLRGGSGRARAAVTTLLPAVPAGAGGGGGKGAPRRGTMTQRLSAQLRVVGSSLVWWEAVVLVRKAGVVLLAVLVTNPYLQCVGASLWFAAFGLLQLHYAPYEKALFNRLEAVSLGACFATAVVSSALLQYNVGVAAADQHAPAAMTPVEWAVTVALVAINLAAFFVLAGAWLTLQCRRAGAAVRVGMARLRTTSTPPSPPQLPRLSTALEGAEFTPNPLRSPGGVPGAAAAGAAASLRRASTAVYTAGAAVTATPPPAARLSLRRYSGVPASATAHSPVYRAAVGGVAHPTL